MNQDLTERIKSPVENYCDSLTSKVIAKKIKEDKTDIRKFMSNDELKMYLVFLKKYNIKYKGFTLTEHGILMHNLKWRLGVDSGHVYTIMHNLDLWGDPEWRKKWGKE